MNPHEDEKLIEKDVKFNPNNFNKLCIPEDYMPEEGEEEEADDPERNNDKIETTVTKEDSKSDLFSIIQDQLSNPKLTKKDKRKLKKKLKKQLKKSESKTNSEDEDCLQGLDSLNLHS
jgi:hypothetical protein